MAKGWSCGAALAVAALVFVAPAAAKMTAEQRIEQLERALKAAQDEIQDLKREVRSNQQAQEATQQQVQQATQQAAEATKSASAIDTLQKRIPSWLERISLFGDLRIRHDGFYHMDVPHGTYAVARNRERFRARIGLRYTYSDELSATLRLASGDPNDPISTNQTFANGFTRKNINLDWAFLTVSPGRTFGWRPGVLELQGGKMPLPFFKPTEMVWDDDLSVEGFSQRVRVLDKPIAWLDQVNVWGEQWTTQEVSNHEDGWIFGGQINPQGHAFGASTWELGVGHFWYLNPGLIAQQLNTNKSLFNSNAVDTADGKITDYASGFSETELAAQLIVPDVALGMPLIPYAEYVYNWQGVTNRKNGVTGGLRFGRPSKRGDWALVAQYEYLQREAALSAFAWSDFGPGGTNLQGPTIGADYQLFDPLVLQVRSSFVNYIDRPADTPNKTGVRLLVDAMVKF